MRRLLAALSIAAAVTGAAVAPAARAADAGTTGAGGYVTVSPTRVWNEVMVGPHVVKNVRIAGVADVPATGVGAVALTISAFRPSGTGSVVVYAAGAIRPHTANLQVRPGVRSADLALVQPGTDGRASVYNNSNGHVTFSIDISGYYVKGATAALKSYHPVKASRILDMTIRKNTDVSPFLSGVGPLPGVLVGALAVTVTERHARGSGYLGAKATDQPITGAKILHWTPDVRASAFAIVPLNGSGQLSLTNFSDAAVEIAVDVVGYYLQGPPHEKGMLTGVPGARLLGPAGVRSESEISVSPAGHGGIPQSGVRAVVLTVTVTAARAGSVLIYSGPRRPKAATVQFAANQTTSDTAILDVRDVPVIRVHNHSPDSVTVSLDVTGWILDATNEVPPTQVGRYVRNLVRGHSAANARKMHAEGEADHAAHLVLLYIGEQRDDRSGVQLSATSIERHHLDYVELAEALEAYADGYAAAGGTGRIAISTNNDADDWKRYPADQRGTDWWQQVVRPVAASAPAGVTIVGATDIQWRFGTHEFSDALGWEAAYQGSAQRPLIVDGTADDCPVVFERPGRDCLGEWTEQQVFDLVSLPNVTVLPRIHNAWQAIQWTNVDQTGRGRIVFAGVLTENPVDGSYPAANGWAALRNGLATLMPTPNVPDVVELHVDD